MKTKKTTIFIFSLFSAFSFISLTALSASEEFYRGSLEEINKTFSSAIQAISKPPNQHHNSAKLKDHKSYSPHSNFGPNYRIGKENRKKNPDSTNNPLFERSQMVLDTYYLDAKRNHKMYITLDNFEGTKNVLINPKAQEFLEQFLKDGTNNFGDAGIYKDRRLYEANKYFSNSHYQEYAKEYDANHFISAGLVANVLLSTKKKAYKLIKPDNTIEVLFIAKLGLEKEDLTRSWDSMHFSKENFLELSFRWNFAQYENMPTDDTFHYTYELYHSCRVSEQQVNRKLTNKKLSDGSRIEEADLVVIDFNIIDRYITIKVL